MSFFLVCSKIVSYANPDLIVYAFAGGPLKKEMTPAEKLEAASQLAADGQPKEGDASASTTDASAPVESEDDRVKRVTEENSSSSKYRINIKSIVVLVKRIIYSDKIYSHHQRLLAGGISLSDDFGARIWINLFLFFSR